MLTAPTPLAVLATGFLSACLASGPMRTDLSLAPPAAPALDMSFVDTIEGTTWSLGTPGGGLTGRSGALVWRNNLEEQLAVRHLRFGSRSGGSGMVPAGAATWQLCVDLEGESRGAGVRPFLVQGGRVLPSERLGSTNLYYQLRIFALDATQAQTLAAPVAAGHTDAPVSPLIEVLFHVAATRTQTGVQLRVGSTSDLPGCAAFFGGQLVADRIGKRGWMHHELYGWHLYEVELSTELLDAAPDEDAGPGEHQASELVVQTDRGGSPRALGRFALRLEFKE
ncbi:MAG: hypothetical protein P1V81_07070 [Planctomycetota bacterium]|nr:hypothetical protein [Planctomycetota bacterium]